MTIFDWYLIFAVIRIALDRTRLGLKKRGTVLLEVITMVENNFVVVGIIKTRANMKGTSLD